MNLPALPSAKKLTSRPPPEETKLEPWRNPDWQRLWLSTQNEEWRTLALVPAADGAPANFTLQVAMALARTGMAHLSEQVHVADGTNLSMGASSQFTAQVRESTLSGPVLIALAPCSVSPVTLSIAQSADRAILCVRLGAMHISEAKQTLRLIGPERFMGSLIIR